MQDTQNLDCLLVLGRGVERAKYRAAKAAEIMQGHEDLPVIVSGSHSGVYGRELPVGSTKECDETFRELMKYGLENYHIIKEGSSLCTLGNMVFSSRMIPKETQKMGLVTDSPHMERATWLGCKTFPNVEIVPISTEEQMPTSIRVTERLLLKASKIDLRNIENGDIPALRGYLDTRNPMYNPNAKFSWFGLCVYMQRARLGIKAKPL